MSSPTASNQNTQISRNDFDKSKSSVTSPPCKKEKLNEGDDGNDRSDKNISSSASTNTSDKSNDIRNSDNDNDNDKKNFGKDADNSDRKDNHNPGSITSDIKHDNQDDKGQNKDEQSQVESKDIREHGKESTSGTDENISQHTQDINESKSKKQKPDPSKPEGIVDMDTFGQILEMDEDESDREFSHGIVLNFYEQAHTTFGELDNALKSKDLPTLHAKGHFLKGSSAALGLIKVKQSCEAIQVLGKLKDPKSQKDLNEHDAISKVGTVLQNAKDEYDEAEGWLKAFYDE